MIVELLAFSEVLLKNNPELNIIIVVILKVCKEFFVDHIAIPHLDVYKR